MVEHRDDPSDRTPADQPRARRAPARLAAGLVFLGLTLLSAGPGAAWQTDYRYHYVVKTSAKDWILETYLLDPKGRHRGAGDFAAGSDPKDGHDHWGICRSTVVA